MSMSVQTPVYGGHAASLVRTAAFSFRICWKDTSRRSGAVLSRSSLLMRAEQPNFHPGFYEGGEPAAS